MTKKIISYLLVFILIVASTPISLLEVKAENTIGTNYYIDSENGNDTNSGTSESSAWKTLDKVNSVVFEPGDNILFKSGGMWTGRLKPQGSGAEGAPIKIDKYGGDVKPIINGSGSNILDGYNEGCTILLYNQEYWEIRNLEITNTSTSSNAACEGIWVIAKDFGTADHFVIEDCYIHNLTSNWRASTKLNVLDSGRFTDSQVGDNLGCGAISFKAAAGGELIPTRFNGIKISGNTLCDTGFMTCGITVGSEWTNDQVAGFYELWAEPYYSTNILISNNYLYNTAAAITLCGVDGSVGDGVVIEHNVAHDNNESSSHWVFWHTFTKDVVWQFNEVYDYDNGGTGDGGCFDTDGNTEGTIFQYNYSRNIRAGVFTFCDVTWAPEKFNYHFVNDCVYRYNISQNDNWGSRKNEGTFHGAGGHGYIYNNVIYVEGYNNCIIDFPIKEENEHYIYNNIFYYKNGSGSYVANKDAGKIFVENNCFYGVDMPTDVDTNYVVRNNLSVDPLFVDAGHGAEGFSSLDGYKLQANSPLIGMGKVIENNGGRDLWGNPVSPTLAPDIGAFQTAYSTSSVRKPADNLTATEITEEQFRLNWDHATDKSAISKYVVYLNGKSYKTLWTNGRIDVTKNSQIIDGLKPSTEYKVKLLAYGYDGNYSESQEIKVTTKNLTTNESKVYVKQIDTYSHDMVKSTISPATTFNAGDVINFKALIVDLDGEPVRNARVEVQLVAVGFNFTKFRAATTDKDGIAEFGTRADYLPKTSFEFKANILKVEKEGYTYDKTNPSNVVSKTVTVNGYDAEFSGNIVYNPGFESLNASGKPVDWSTIATNNASAVNVVKDAGHDGGNSIIDIRASKATEAVVQQILYDIPNGAYTLTLWVKNNNPASSITVDKNGTSSRKISIPMSESWEQVSINNINITTGQLRIRIESSLTGDYSIYSQIDEVELTRNLLYNTSFYDIYPIKDATIPSNYYYTTEKSQIGPETTDFSSFTTDENLQAVTLHHYAATEYKSAVRVSSPNGFKFSMGQLKENLLNGTYTFSVLAKATGGIDAYLAVYDENRTLLGKTKIESSKYFKINKVSGVKITGKTAYVELMFEGEGNINEYVEFFDADFSNRSDIPGSSVMNVIPGQNLLDDFNGDFEEDKAETQGQPAGWVNNSFVGNGNAYVSSEESYTGKYSMKITLDEDGYHNPKPGIFTQFGTAPKNSFTNLPAGIYTLTWYVKTDFRFKFTVKTNNSANSYESWSVANEQWQKITVNNIVVEDGTLSFSFWCFKTEESPETMQYAYVDSMSLVLNSSTLHNGNAEEVKNGKPNGWSVTESKGYSEIISSKDAYLGDYSIKNVLPGTNSSIKVTSASKVNLNGLYDFSARVKGNGIIKFTIKPIGEAEIHTESVVANEQWQMISLENLNIESGIESIYYTVVNGEDNTSSYVCVDEINLAKRVTVKDIAASLASIPAVYQTEDKVTIPKTYSDNYSVEIFSSSNESIIDLEGNVTTPKDDIFITLVLKVTNNDDATDFTYVSKIATVYGKNS